jgi:hypothetical protein
LQAAFASSPQLCYKTTVAHQRTNQLACKRGRLTPHWQSRVQDALTNNAESEPTSTMASLILKSPRCPVIEAPARRFSDAPATPVPLISGSALFREVTTDSCFSTIKLAAAFQAMDLSVSLAFALRSPPAN